MHRESLALFIVGLAVSLLASTVAQAGPEGAGEIITKYRESFGPADAFLNDDNGNFIWNGTAGGDSVTLVAPGSGPGTPVIGDAGAPCKYSGSSLFCDANLNGLWEGNAGGDLSTVFALGAGDGTFLFADTSGDGVKEIVKYVESFGPADAFLIDLNQNGVWNGTAGGDAVHLVAPGSGPGTPFACDCDGNGTVELGKFIDSLVFADTSNDGTWGGNPGGDLSSNFAPGAGDGPFVFAPLGGGADLITQYIASLLGGNDAFLSDLNGNNLWDGGAGGDMTTLIAPGAGAGTPCGIDADGDGTAVLCKVINASSSVFADLNANGVWEGNAGGDLASVFASGAGAGTILVREAPAGL